MKHVTATLCTCCLAALAQTAAAGTTTITLPSPNTPGPAPPPLAGGPQLSSEPGEVRVPGSLDNAEAVRVGLAQNGNPVSVVVVQRLSIRGLGDFRFVVPAPAVAVAPAGASQSLPGLRQAGIVWQGFSPGRRLLGARITLRPAQAAAGLPLRVSVEQRTGLTRVRLENRTARQFAITRGSVALPALQAVLARVRRELGREVAAGRPLPMVLEQVQGRGTGQRIVPVDSPLRVTGRITVAGGRTATVDAMLGGDYPRSRMVVLRGEGRATMALDAAFERDRRKLLPKADGLASSADPLVALQTALARTAVALQFQQYLASPKVGATRTTYRYVTARVVAWSVALLISTVENASRLTSKKSQMTMRMLRFMTASDRSGRPPARAVQWQALYSRLQAATFGAPGAGGKF